MAPRPPPSNEFVEIFFERRVKNGGEGENLRKFVEARARRQCRRKLFRARRLVRFEDDIPASVSALRDNAWGLVFKSSLEFATSLLIFLGV